MEVLKISNSSAIAKISFNSQESKVGIAYTYKPDNFYVFECNDVENFENQLTNVIKVKESIGKFIAVSRKDGTLIAV